MVCFSKFSYYWLDDMLFHLITQKEKQYRFSILTTMLGGIRNQAYHTAFTLKTVE